MPICGTPATAISAGAPTARSAQLEQAHPHCARSAAAAPTATFGTPVEQLDLGTVVKVSQAVSGEIDLKKLIETS